jgi:hypothetical protein
MLTKTTPICIQGETYGYYNPETDNFSCTHGAWDCKATLFSTDKVRLHMSHMPNPVPFEVLESIPEDSIR